MCDLGSCPVSANHRDMETHLFSTELYEPCKEGGMNRSLGGRMAGVIGQHTLEDGLSIP